MEFLRKNIKHAVFGAFDGLTVVLGVILGLYSSRPDLIFPTAVAVGVAESIGMVAGEWLSESRSGYSGPIAIGLATLVGSTVPAIPFMMLSASSAATLSAVLFLLAALAIASARAAERGWVRSNLETVAILAAVAMAVWLLS